MNFTLICFSLALTLCYRVRCSVRLYLPVVCSRVHVLSMFLVFIVYIYIELLYRVII